MARDERTRFGGRERFGVVQDMQIAREQAQAIIVGRKRASHAVIHVPHQRRDRVMLGADNGQLHAFWPAIDARLSAGHQIRAADTDLRVAPALRCAEHAAGIHEQKKIVIVLRGHRARAPVDRAAQNAPAEP